MEQKENQRIMLTKRLLRESLLRLIAKKDIQKISVAELCRDAGINRVTFYNHYNIPFDVMDDIEKELIAQLDSDVKKESVNSKKTDSHQRESVCRFLREHLPVVKALFQNYSAESQFAYDLFQLSLSDEKLNQLFSDTHSPDKKRLMAAYIIHGAYGMLQKWILEDIELTAKEISELINKVSMAGIE